MNSAAQIANKYFFLGQDEFAAAHAIKAYNIECVAVLMTEGLSEDDAILAARKARRQVSRPA